MLKKDSTLERKTLLLNNVFISSSSSKDICAGCNGAGRINNRFGERVCYICMGSGEVSPELNQKYQEAFYAYMKKLEDN